MRKREKQRIFKRFINGESVIGICLSVPFPKIQEVEQSIRECVWDEIKKWENK